MTISGQFVSSVLGGHITLYVTVLSIFAGSLAAGIAGFAFSAIAGAMLLHWLHPIDAVPLLLACSIANQLFSISTWRRGFAGMLSGAKLLESFNPHAFAVGFGLFLICYTIYMLLRPHLTYKGAGRLAEIIGGFAGGITGATAFAGALAASRCIVRGPLKLQQRGVVQLLMRIATLIYFCNLGILPGATLTTDLWCVPAVLAAAGLGLFLFDRLIKRFRHFLLLYGIVLMT